MILNDKSTVQQVIGSLIKRPSILSEIDKYSLDLKDFTSLLDKYIFAAIVGLYRQGASSIEPIDIENYLELNPSSKSCFENNNGIEYLQDIIDFTQEENFPYYYNKLKKLNLLRDLSKQGFDVSNFYESDLTKPEAVKINREFENLTTQDICNSIKKKLSSLESNYAKSDEIVSSKISDGLQDIIDNIGKVVDIGIPIQGRILNEVINGAERKALTIRAAASGTGKTRAAVSDACFMAFPIRFNSNEQKWEQVGGNEKILFIITEQTEIQIQKMVLAYITDIDESKFKYGHFTDEESKRIEIAFSIIKRFEDNFSILKMPTPTIETLKAQIREKCLTTDLSCIFFDYIFINPALLNEFKGFTLRNDEILLMMSTALKDLAVEQNVAIFTSTQVNASADDNKNIRNEASLAGGRSTINKADNGMVMARPTAEELEILEPISNKIGIPNLVTDVFKVRSGRWTQIRIWSKVDLGRLKREDLFITDARLNVISDFSIENEYKIENWEDEKDWKEINETIIKLNEGKYEL